MFFTQFQALQHTKNIFFRTRYGSREKQTNKQLPLATEGLRMNLNQVFFVPKPSKIMSTAVQHKIEPQQI